MTDLDARSAQTAETRGVCPYCGRTLTTYRRPQDDRDYLYGHRTEPGGETWCSGGGVQVREPVRVTRLETISDLTGFDRGDKFTSEQQVRDYFTVAEMRLMFGSDWDALDQDDLDLMAETVIDQRWHFAAWQAPA